MATKKKCNHHYIKDHTVFGDQKVTVRRCKKCRKILLRKVKVE